MIDAYRTDLLPAAERGLGASLNIAGYRAAIETGLSINVAPLVGHSVIRLWVMGGASQERAATADEIKAMQDLLRECLDGRTGQ